MKLFLSLIILLGYSCSPKKEKKIIHIKKEVLKKTTNSIPNIEIKLKKDRIFSSGRRTVNVNIYNKSSCNVYFSILYPIIENVLVYKMEKRKILKDVSFDWIQDEYDYYDLNLYSDSSKYIVEKKEFSETKKDSILAFIKSKLKVVKPGLENIFLERFSETVYDSMIFIEAGKIYSRNIYFNSLPKGQYKIVVFYPSRPEMEERIFLPDLGIIYPDQILNYKKVSRLTSDTLTINI